MGTQSFTSDPPLRNRPRRGTVDDDIDESRVSGKSTRFEVRRLGRPGCRRPTSRPLGRVQSHFRGYTEALFTKASVRPSVQEWSKSP